MKSESISAQPLNFSTPQLPSGTISYTHDNVGNRLTRTSTVAGVPNQVFTYDNNDRLNGDSWDNNGNTVTANASLPVLQSLGEGGNPGIRGTDSYDSENHLTTRTGANGESVTILYDGDGNRGGETVAKDGITTTTTYLVDTLNPTGYAQVLEEQSNGAVTRVYLFGHDLIAQDTRTSSGTEANWQRFWYGYDGHGTTRFLTDDAGQVVEAYEYEAFGQLLKGWTPSAPQTPVLGPQTHYLYCGEQFDSALGLYHLRARLMNPLTGRFWTMDGYEGEGADPVSLHKYLWCVGDPVDGIDPTGHFSLSEINLTAAIQATLVGINVVGAVLNTKRAVEYGVASYNYFHGDDPWNGTVSAGLGIVHVGFAALNLLGVKGAMAPPPPPTAGAALAGVVGVQQLWQFAAANPAFEQWLWTALWPTLSGVGGLTIFSTGHQADWELRNSGGQIKTRGSADSGGTHPGRRLSWQEQLLTHTERTILEKALEKASPGDIVTIRGTLPPCKPGCIPEMARFAREFGIKIMYSADDQVWVFRPDGVVIAPN